jgi:hypothetical protein
MHSSSCNADPWSFADTVRRVNGLPPRFAPVRARVPARVSPVNTASKSRIRALPHSSDGTAKIPERFVRVSKIFLIRLISLLITWKRSDIYLPSIIRRPFPGPLGWQKEATVVRHSIHISALCAANAWSFNRPSDRGYMRTEGSMSLGFVSMRPEQSFQTPR